MTTNTATGPLIAYARVSTGEQDAQLQRDALTAAGCARIFEDTASGKNAERPELTAALNYLREGDTLVVWKLDRLGRSLIDLVTIVDALRARGIGFKVLTGALSAVDTTSADGRLFFQIIAAMAEFERELIKDRTKAGLAAAKAQGKVGGRPKVMDAKGLLRLRRSRPRGRATAPLLGLWELVKRLSTGRSLARPDRAQQRTLGASLRGGAPHGGTEVLRIAYAGTQSRAGAGTGNPWFS